MEQKRLQLIENTCETSKDEKNIWSDLYEGYKTECEYEDLQLVKRSTFYKVLNTDKNRQCVSTMMLDH